MKKQKHYLKRKHIHKRRRVYLTLLALPPTVAAILIGFITIASRIPVISQEGIMLSPIKDPTPLIFSLIMFIVGYFVFVGLIFKQEIIKLFLHKA